MKIVERFGQFVLQDNKQAALLVFFCALAPIFNVPFLSWVGIVVLGLIALRRGIWFGTGAWVAFLLPSLVFWLWYGDATFLLEQALAGGLVVVVLALLLRYFSHWSLVIEISLWVGVVVVALIHVFATNLVGFWLDYLHVTLTEWETIRGTPFGFSQDLLNRVAHLATGIAVAGVVINGLFNVFVSRAWQARLFNPKGFQREFHGVRMGYSVTLGLVVVLVLMWFSVDTAWDILPLFVTSFFVSGLSLMHFQMAKSRWAWIVIALFYVLLAFAFVIMASFVVIVGLVDSLFNVRQYGIKS